jgi:hypothetical protein
MSSPGNAVCFGACLFGVDGYGMNINNGNISLAGSGNVSFGGLYNTVANWGVSYSSPGGVFTTVLNGASKGAGGGLSASTTAFVSFGGTFQTWARSFEYWPYSLSTSQLQTLAPSP